MSLVEPSACGYMKISAFILITEHVDNAYQQFINQFCEDQPVFITYDQFRRNFLKIVDSVKYVGKHSPDRKQQLISIFHPDKWRQLSKDNQKKHTLKECHGCLEDCTLRQLLTYFHVKGKHYRKRARELKENKGETDYISIPKKVKVAVAKSLKSKLEEHWEKTAIVR